MLSQTKHAVESNPRVVAGALIHGDAVHYVALAQIFEHPEQMLRSDTEHRRANADAGIERNDFVVLQFLAEAVDAMDFRADGPFGAGRRSLGCFHDGLRLAAVIVGPGD